jgi:hypothetical protein
MSSAIADFYTALDVGATQGPWTIIKGGTFGVTVSFTGSGSVILNKRSADGETYVPVENINGSAAGFTANGYQVFKLATGTYEFAVTTVTAVYIEAIRIHGE